MKYRKLGKSGLKLPIISFGLWQNVDFDSDIEIVEDLIYTAFANGITHFDLANGYGYPNGSAESKFGEVLARGFNKYRDQIIISTKAGYQQYEGPYGFGGSRKHLMNALVQSLERMGIEYVDIFYHHCPDEETDLRETMLAMRDIVLQGKAMYIGLSKYEGKRLSDAIEMLDELNVPYIVSQNRYNIIENSNKQEIATSKRYDRGFIAFSPLSQGKLSNKYIDGIPVESRANNNSNLYDEIDGNLRELLMTLKLVADNRNISIVQLSLLWGLSNENVHSLIGGFRTKEQLLHNLEIIDMELLTELELATINEAADEYRKNK